MDYEEIIKEAMKFKSLGVGGKIRRLFGKKIAPKTLSPKQSPEGRMGDKMMKEFVESNPRLARGASEGSSSRLSRKWEKHQKRYIKSHDLPEAPMKRQMSSNPQVLAKQVQRHHRRSTRPARKAAAAAEAKARNQANIEAGKTPLSKPKKKMGLGTTTALGGSGLAVGVTGGRALNRDDKPAAGYAGGGAYGR
jgi:hypothetical protein